MKIAYCIPSTYNSGGMERVLAKKTSYLADVMNWDVSIITTSQHERPSFYALSDKIVTLDLGIDYEAIMRQPLLKRITSRLAAKKRHKERLESALNKLKPDVTVSMFTHEMTFLPSIKDGSKKILELHFSKDFRVLDAKSNNTPLLLRTINAVLDSNDRRHINEYDRFVVLSNRDAADWGSQYPRISVIPNPSTFDTTVANQKAMTRKALAVGRLCPQKGFDMLVKAWGMLPDRLKTKWTLDIVGSGPDYANLRHLIDSAGLNQSITILPPTKDVKELYQSHSIYCFPSRYEGFGLSLMEAMSFGAASVAFDCPCGPSEMIDNGENGFLVTPGDIPGFAAGLERLMDDEILRSSIGDKAALTIKSRFSEEVVMRQWVTLFEGLKNTEQ